MAREASILEAFFSRRPRPIDADAALVSPPPGQLALATDALEEGVHFRAGWLSLEDVAWKALAVNLSDLAAAGAEPLGCLLALAWPEQGTADEAARLGEALAAAEKAMECPLLGGDTDVRAGALRLDVTVVGCVQDPMRRSGARPGDALFVSGPLGGAAAVVAERLAGRSPAAGDPDWADALRRFARPVPRLDVARAVRGLARAAIDLSDGLRIDAGHLARQSGLCARLDAASLPRHPAASGRDPDLALDGGEDYELLVAGPDSLADVQGLVRVGRLEAGPAGRVFVE